MAQVGNMGSAGGMRSRVRGAAARAVKRKMLVAAVVGLVVLGVVVVGMPLAGSSGVVLERGGAASAAERGQTGASDSATAGSANESAVTSGGDMSAQAPDATVVVHVDGAVANPGVYSLAGEAPRVNDAVVAAGGLAQDADTSVINLAATVADGAKVHVPSVGEAAQSDAAAQSSGLDGGVAGDGASASASASGLVNINTATAEELDTLPGVGPSTAAAIIEDREANGPFSSPEDLMRVSGIGEKKYAKLQGSICV